MLIVRQRAVAGPVAVRRDGAARGASRPRRRSSLRWLESGLWSLALAVAAWLGYVALDRSIYDRQQVRAPSELALPAATPESAPVAMRQLPASGAPLGRLEIPGAGISVVVAAGTETRTLRRGVGHIDGTALPGEPGNIGLAGHRDTVFRGLRKLRPSDRIFLVTPSESIEYAVESLRTVAPERGDVLDSSAQPTLTLVTCFPFDFVGPAPMRYVVRAREVGRVAVAPAAASAPRDAGAALARHP